MKNLKTLAKSVCKATLLVGMVLATTMSFAQNIQKAGSGTSLSLEKGGKKIVNETFEKIATYNAKADLIPAKLNGKWGFYNNDGKLVIPHQYETLYANTSGEIGCWYGAGIISLKLNGNYILIDKTGKESKEYADMIPFNFPEGKCLCVVKKDGKYGLANDEKVLTPIKYDQLQQHPRNTNTFIANEIVAGKGNTVILDINGRSEGEAKFDNYVCGFCGEKKSSDGEPTATKGCKHTLSRGHHKWVKQ